MTADRFEDGQRVVQRWDRVFGAVAAEPRRQLVLSLVEAPADGSVPLPEGAVNRDLDVDREDLRRDLYHTHLPKLVDHGFVEWVADPLVARRGPRLAEVAAVFEAIRAQAPRLPDSLVEGCHALERARERCD